MPGPQVIPDDCRGPREASSLSSRISIARDMFRLDGMGGLWAYLMLWWDL